ncbi:MAG: penicillin-binding protein 2, partial [Elusimicrobiota bacterium]
MRSSIDRRAWIPLAGVFVIFAAILLRLGQLQLLMHRSLSERSDKEVISVKRERPLRARIFDRKGRLLAASVLKPSIFVSKNELKVPRFQVAAKLAAAIEGVEYKQVVAALSGKTNFAWIKRFAEVEDGERVRKLGLQGVGIEMEQDRVYPHEQVAMGLLGAVGIDGQGLRGLEKGLNPLLAGPSKERVLLRDALGKVFAERTVSRGGAGSWFGFGLSKDQEGPFDVHLTIDIELQSLAEMHAKGMMRKYGARAAIVVVLDAATGGVLTMASIEDAALGLDADIDPNFAVSYTFEPGSVLKPFVMAGALAANVVGDKDTFDCEHGRYAILPNLIVRDHEPQGVLNIDDIMAYSSNIGMAKIGAKMGRQSLYNVLRDFGFGVKTAVPMTGEAVGILPQLQNWSAATLPNVSFGQGMATTALQLTNAYTAFASGGVLFEPQIIDHISTKYAKAPLYQAKRQQIRRALPATFAKQAVTMMEGVVVYGTGAKAAVAGYRIAGKTGTAQKI